MTNYYQLLDCTTNKCAKEFMKNKFSTCNTKEVQSELNRRHRHKVSINHDETLACKLDNTAVQ